VLPTSTASLHDLGAFVFGDDALHLEQQVILRAVPQRAIQKHNIDASATPLVHQKHLISVVASQPVRGMDVDSVDHTCQDQVAQLIEGWAN
jgi:hypothetical protein